ncbi:hypothetical protein JHK84_050289 [Glycine max]|nr:hypothetical protein JHK86_050229 [Glycine max]KAG5094701.1 hypothetical protein JHK84_050289 [Glycine max]
MAGDWPFISDESEVTASPTIKIRPNRTVLEEEKTMEKEESTEQRKQAKLAIMELANMISAPMALNIVVRLNVTNVLWQGDTNNPFSAAEILPASFPTAATMPSRTSNGFSACWLVTTSSTSTSLQKLSPFYIFF